MCQALWKKQEGYIHKFSKLKFSKLKSEHKFLFVHSEIYKNLPTILFFKVFNNISTLLINPIYDSDIFLTKKYE